MTLRLVCPECGTLLGVATLDVLDPAAVSAFCNLDHAEKFLESKKEREE